MGRCSSTSTAKPYVFSFVRSHYCQGASDLRVTLIDQSSYPAKVVGAEPDKDVAVLELDAPENVIRSLKPISVGQSSRLLVRLPTRELR